MAGTVKVCVAHGYAVAYDGVQHGGGAELDVPSALAEQWVAMGWAEPIKAPRKRS